MVSNGLILSLQMKKSLVNELSDDLAWNEGVFVAIQSTTVLRTAHSSHFRHLFSKYINFAKHKSEASGSVCSKPD